MAVKDVETELTFSEELSILSPSAVGTRMGTLHRLLPILLKPGWKRTKTLDGRWATVQETFAKAQFKNVQQLCAQLI